MIAVSAHQVLLKRIDDVIRQSVFLSFFIYADIAIHCNSLKSCLYLGVYKGNVMR